MPTVLITTDFSAASRHALDYACLLLRGKGVTLDLLHIFPVPVTYTTDGMAIAAMGSAIERAGDMMQDEVQRTRSAFSDIEIEGRVITGSFLETLRQETRLVRPQFMILGTVGFADLYIGDADPLNALRMLHVPVLFVPYGAPLKPLKSIAYACNFAHVGPQTPVREITDWVRFMDADLQVVHTDANAHGLDERQMAGEGWLQGRLADLQPDFHWVQDADVLRGLTGFIGSHEIDCMLVVPRKYGIWENLFHQSRTKALARLNKVPVIAFHSRE